MKAFIGKEIIIRDATEKFKSDVLPHLVLKNPEYYKKMRMGFYVKNIPEQIYLYSELKKEHDYSLPFGCIRYIESHKDEFEEIYDYTHQNGSNSFDFGSNINLYPYQENAVKTAIQRKNGVVVMPCGSGKTQCGLEIMSRIGGKALWLTHTHDLLKQSKERAELVLTLNVGDVGVISEGKVEIGDKITFATVQTAAKSFIPDVFDVIVVDECHHCIGSPTKIMMFYKVLSELSARYRFGLTATPERSDGLSTAMYALLGSKVIEIPKSEIKTVPARFEYVETFYEPDYNEVCNPDGTLNFNALIKEVTEDCERNKTIVEKVLSVDGASLVLTDRVAHGKLLKNMIPDSEFIDARNKKERESILERLKNGDLKTVIATYPLAKEGLDCPNLRNLFLASPIKEKNTVVQSVGRVIRAADGKEYGTVFDFVDSDNGLLEKWSVIRRRIFNSL